MDFLETDFHKRRFPKRSIKLRNNDNLLVGLNLQKYQNFNKQVWKLIQHNFDKEVLTGAEKGVYRTNLPKNLLDLIKLQVEKITKDQIKEDLEQLASEIENAATLYAQEYDKALTTSLEAGEAIFKKDLVVPLMESISKTLQNLNLGDENDIFLIEEELTSVLLRLAENKISEILNLLISKTEVDIQRELKSVFKHGDVKENISIFFENLQVADLFTELYEMERNKSILDKQEFYLYFGDIAFQNIKYPIFYIPVSVRKAEDKLFFDFDSQVYINKKALEYIVQEYHKENGTQGSLTSINNRIFYIAQHESDLATILDEILNEVTNFFGLDSRVTFSALEPQLARGKSIRVSNACYINLFDKSDEALVNDYEEILQLVDSDGNVLGGIFNELIDDFIHKNPQPFNPAIEDEWENTSTAERLAFTSPIPLNSEQLQILAAVRSEGCKYIIVEGPPGTGKSHTITAIVFDAVLKNRSVLVLSDKKEALDVVEENITKTMNKVRYDKSFQNPILRLGKTGNTYAQILARGTIEGIKTHYKAVNKEHELLDENIVKSTNSLKEDLEAEILAYKDIDLKEIHEFFDLDTYYQDKTIPIDIDEVINQVSGPVDLEELRKTFSGLRDKFLQQSNNQFLQLFNLKALQSTAHFNEFLMVLETTKDCIEKLKSTFGSSTQSLLVFEHFKSDEVGKLGQYLKDFEELKAWLVGYAFNKKKVEKLDFSFRESFLYNQAIPPHENLNTIKSAYSIASFIKQLSGQLNHNSISHQVDYIYAVHSILSDERWSASFNDFLSAAETFQYLQEIVQAYPKTIEKIGFDNNDLSTIYTNQLSQLADLEFDKLVRYIVLRQKLGDDFAKIPQLNYGAREAALQNLVTTQATYKLDGRLVKFYENNKGDAETLRNIIKNKQRFPKEEFVKLKEAFPCILAGIRDYAEYIPLEPGMFDLVIIDEASQVSIAQAFPALLRAKKVLILGDKKQFSNIKAAQARSDTNREYLNRLETSFKENISSKQTELVRLGKFNIKTSILEFFEFISNYHIQLLKHFRGYKEIISYSNKYFYQDTLQVMKIRGKPIDDVIRFSQVEADENSELYPNTNVKEVEFIISELKKLKDEGSKLSVGIITPHTNQQKLLVDMIGKLPEQEFFYDEFELKIMTFDTCQGEERDIVFYSMVATEKLDRLWGVFIKDFSQVDVEEDGQIKAQRLNVGLSRAKECAHFVVSKPLEQFNGSIGEALRHYKNVLDETKKERSVIETDEKSKMEPEVMTWFYQTDFWKQNKDHVEFIPQFEIGKYLKQLDRTYTHPNYKVDFLLIYRDETHQEHKIIIEYDGFREHFQDIEGVNEFNYKGYYSDADVYREKVLESYGYKFLRINKFNVGNNPIKTLDERIAKLIRSEKANNTLLDNIHDTIEGLGNGKMKECPKCKEVRSLVDFKDASLITGYGRFCKYCKNKGATEAAAIPRPAPVLTDVACPRCGSKMILRNGRRGRFYGCSKFPYCKGTKNYIATT